MTNVIEPLTKYYHTFEELFVKTDDIKTILDVFVISFFKSYFIIYCKKLIIGE